MCVCALKFLCLRIQTSHNKGLIHGNTFLKDIKKGLLGFLLIWTISNDNAELNLTTCRDILIGMFQYVIIRIVYEL